MSRKIVFSLVAVLVCVSLVGCGKKDDDQIVPQKGLKESDPKSLLESVEESGIKGLLAKKAKLRCEYQIEDEDQGMNAVVFIDGDRFKTVTNVGEMKASAVFDGETYYTWTEGEVSQGTKITKNCLEEMESQLPEDEAQEEEAVEFGSVEEIVAQEEQMKMHCSEVGEIDFKAPEGIKFMDTCKMMEDMQNLPQDMDKLQEQMEQMQKDMGV